MTNLLQKSWLRGAAIMLLLLSFQLTAQAESEQAESDQDESLVSLLSDELDISTKKARGGAGAIFAYVKDNVDREDFEIIAEGIPEMDSLLDAAPETDSGSRMGRASRRLRDFDSSMGDVAGLAASFEEINLDYYLLEDFKSVMFDYVDSESGEEAAEIFDDAF